MLCSGTTSGWVCMDFGVVISSGALKGSNTKVLWILQDAEPQRSWKNPLVFRLFRGPYLSCFCQCGEVEVMLWKYQGLSFCLPVVLGIICDASFSVLRASLQISACGVDCLIWSHHTENKYSVRRFLLFEQHGRGRLEGQFALALQVAELNLQHLRTTKPVLAFFRELPGILSVSLWICVCVSCQLLKLCRLEKCS